MTLMPPTQQRWGQLIAEALERRRMSVRSLARRVGLSQTQISAIIHGYRTTGGIREPERGSDDAIARIAVALRITPAQLSAAEREGAAQLLEAWAGHEMPNPTIETIRDDPLISDRDKQMLLTLYSTMLNEHQGDNGGDGDQAPIDDGEVDADEARRTA